VEWRGKTDHDRGFNLHENGSSVPVGEQVERRKTMVGFTAARALA
jgi:hypothetical protein